MEQHDFYVADIQGDYAFLAQTDTDSAEPFQVALAQANIQGNYDFLTHTGTKLRGSTGMSEIIS